MAENFLLNWDKTGERFYETGVKKGVLYPYTKFVDAETSAVSYEYKPGVAWNGLTSVTESPSGAEATAIWADDMKYLNLYSAEELGLSIGAYTYPDAFKACNGELDLHDGDTTTALGAVFGQQTRQSFGLCYRTVLGNDVEGENYGYKLHLVYGCKASPSERAYNTINDSPEAIEFSWDVTTTPINVAGFKPTSVITVDSTKATAAGLAALEQVLYGTPATTGTSATAEVPARLPLPAEVASLLATTAD